MPKVKHREFYQHQRLTSPRSIRVLTLVPSSDFKAPLEVSLKEISLDAIPSPVPPYEALSYVWGSPTGDRPLTCDGKLLLVTPNCESALRHLRQAGHSRNLWIDAICIDQDGGTESMRERNAQVALMGEVYNKATRTLCWLGEGMEFTGKVMAQLERIGSCQSQREFRKLLQFDETLRRAGSLNADSTCLEHIFCHPWHSRIWTVQEVAQSRDCHIICGKATLSWNAYTTAAKFLIFEEFIDELDLQASRNYVGIDIRNTLRNYILGTGTFHAGNDEDEEQVKISYLLTSCLSQVRHLQATKAEDKIFGLYGALTALGVLLPAPDYGKPLARVYEEATVSMIVYSRSLQVLSYASGNYHDQNLPSWVPDWRDNDFKLATPQSDATEGSRVADTDLQVLVPVPGQLQVRGKTIATVTTRSQNDFATLDFISGTDRDRLPILAEEKYDFTNEIDALRLLIHRVRLLREWKHIVETTSSPSDGEEVEDEFFSILCHDNASSPRDLFAILVDLLNYPNTTYELGVGEQLAKGWKAADSLNAAHWSAEMTSCAIIAASLASKSLLRKGGSSLPPGGTALLDLVVDLAGNMGDRALVVVRDHGLQASVLGTAYYAVRVEDVVVLLEGAEYPVVLRAHGEVWRFVSSAFVMGMMDGEAWSNEDGVVGDLQDFVIV